MKNKVIVIGLDGAGFELIMPWIKEGKLPSINKILSKGTYADSLVCLPPTTSPDWKCYSTGKNPAKLGIFWWRNISIKQKKEYFARDRIYSNKEIWDYLGDHNKSVAVVNMPTTYPAKKVNGILVSGGGDCLGTKYTYPDELKQELKEKYGYRIHAHKTSNYTYSAEEIYEDCIDVINRKFAFFKNLIKENKYDFAHLTIFHINTLHHNLWDSPYTLKAWQKIDAHIGEILELTKNKSNIMLMSDHGSNKINVVFNITTWLEKKGYFKMKESKGIKFTKLLKLDTHKILRLLNSIGIKKHYITKLIPKSILRKIALSMPTEFGSIKSKEGNIDWENTTVLATGQGPIYINLEKGTQKYEKIKKELKEELENLKDPETGIKIASRIYEKEEVYTGPLLDEAPDLIIDQGKGVHINGAIKIDKEKKIFEKPKKWLGENKKTGLFAFFGPDIAKKGRIDNVKILDYAPTILHMFGIPIPKDIDGRVLKEAFKEDSTSYKNEVQYEENKVVEKNRINKVIKNFQV